MVNHLPGRGGAHARSHRTDTRDQSVCSFWPRWSQSVSHHVLLGSLVAARRRRERCDAL